VLPQCCDDASCAVALKGLLDEMRSSGLRTRRPPTRSNMPGDDFSSLLLEGDGSTGFCGRMRWKPSWVVWVVLQHNEKRCPIIASGHTDARARLRAYLTPAGTKFSAQCKEASDTALQNNCSAVVRCVVGKQLLKQNTICHMHAGPKVKKIKSREMGLLGIWSMWLLVFSTCAGAQSR
jgi:hypothetical protein